MNFGPGKFASQVHYSSNAPGFRKVPSGGPRLPYSLGRRACSVPFQQASLKCEDLQGASTANMGEGVLPEDGPVPCQRQGVLAELQEHETKNRTSGNAPNAYTYYEAMAYILAGKLSQNSRICRTVRPHHWKASNRPQIPVRRRFPQTANISSAHPAPGREGTGAGPQDIDEEPV
ncbi:unnamed protein product [Eretmochelys imbricata]